MLSVVEVEEITVAFTAPKCTILFAVIVLKLLPLIVTAEPAGPVVGENEFIEGAGTNVKPANEAVPPGVVTLILPDVPEATKAVMAVAETMLKDAAVVPPKLTIVAPVKLVPVNVIVVPGPPEFGVKEEIVGGETAQMKLILNSKTKVILANFPGLKDIFILLGFVLL